MVIVQSRDGTTSCALYADVTAKGDLVVTGHDDADGDDSEYVYTVRAAALPRMCELLSVEPPALLAGLQRELAPHGFTAGAAWRAWLKAHDVPYELTIR